MTTTFAPADAEAPSAMDQLLAQPWYRVALARGLTGPPTDEAGQVIPSGCGTCSGAGTLPVPRTSGRRRTTCPECKGEGVR